MPISAVASVKTSGVLVTVISNFLAASISIFPKPTAKLERIFTLLGNLLIVSESNLSVNADSFVALNGRKSQRFVDPEINLYLEKRSLKNYNWILPFKDEIRGF